MRHKLRSVVVAGTSALLLAAGTGTASAQGSLEFALPLPFEIPGLSSLAADAGPGPDAGPEAGAAPRTAAHGDPVFAMPEEWARMAFEGRIVAGANEARTAVGAERLVTDPVLADRAGERADELAAGDTTTGDLDVPEGVSTYDRTVLTLPADATPEDVLGAMLTDTGKRERMLDGEFSRVGVGLAAAEDQTIHVVLDFGA